jgi:hypothetical protein
MEFLGAYVFPLSNVEWASLGALNMASLRSETVDDVSSRMTAGINADLTAKPIYGKGNIIPKGVDTVLIVSLLSALFVPREWTSKCVDNMMGVEKWGLAVDGK